MLSAALMLLRHGQELVTPRGASPLRVQQPSAMEQLGEVLVHMPWRTIGISLVVAMLLGALALGTREVMLGVDRPVSEVVVKGRFSALGRGDVEGLVNSLVGVSFLYSDLDAVKSRVEAEPWIDAAAVRRVWPDRLEIYTLEQQPVAHWNGASYLNRRIEPFSPAKKLPLAHLPQLAGPQGQEARVWEFWQQTDAAMRKLGSAVTGVTLQPRGAWEIRLAEGARVDLGRDEREPRFERFLKIYPEIPVREDVDYYDARYTNGVAVRWKLIEAPAKDQAGKKRDAAISGN